ncbi:hypothetical protein ACF1E9_28785 [Streptomyces roseolus]|uniref:hypothetical protein n=1 Tax=Streptomyces roseolus TaxID=67358 RepID=UPI0036F7A53D
MAGTTPEPELPDPVPTSPDAVTPDLPPPGPRAPEIRGTGGRPLRSEESEESEESEKPEGSDASDASDEGGTAGTSHDDADARGEGRPAAGPGTPAPQEQPG